MPSVPSNIELVDRADQKKGRYHFEQMESSKTNHRERRGDLFLKVENSNDEDDTMSVGNFSTKMAGEEDYYLGVEMDRHLFLQRKRRNRLVCFLCIVLLSAVVIGSVLVSSRNPEKQKQQPPKNNNNNNPSSVTLKPIATKPVPTPSPPKPTPTHPSPPSATLPPLPSVSTCTPPLVARDKVQAKYDVFHMMNLVIVPEANDDSSNDYEYTFTALDMSDDGSLVSVGMSDFDNYNNDDMSGNYSVGLVRAFGYDCVQQSWTQIGQDLMGTNEDEQFGHAVSTSADGRVMAIAAPQQDYDGGTGFVQVYYYDADDTNRWMLLGQTIAELEYSEYSDYYYDLGHAIDLSRKGETLSVLAWTNDTSFVVRTFAYNSNKQLWINKGADIVSSVEYPDGYEYDPQLSLSQDGEELSIADPQFGVLLYHFDFYADEWKMQSTKSTLFDSSHEDTIDPDEVVYWIESVEMDQTGDLVAFSAFVDNTTDAQFKNMVKLVDYTQSPNGTQVYEKNFADFSVEIATDVSSNGQVACIVASKEDYNDAYYWIGEDVECVGSMTVVTKTTNDNNNKWRVVGKGTKAVNMGVPGNFVRISGDGRIVAVGSESVVAFYGINVDTESEIPSSNTTTHDDNNNTTTIFTICKPFPNASLNDHAGDLEDKLPRQEKEHTLSVAMSKDGSVVAVGIDETNDENLGMARVFAWSCDDQKYKQLGQDLMGTSEFDGFGQSVDLSSDGTVLVVGANQPPPGKSGYVEVYKFHNGTWSLLGERMDQLQDLVEDVGRQVRISDDGNTVLLSGSIVEELSDGWDETGSFMRVVELVDGSWQPKGSDLLGSIAYDDYGANVRVSFAGDGQTVVVTGSYSSFLAKVYEYDKSKKNWTENVIPPIKSSSDDELEEETEYDDDMYAYEYEWDYYYDNYFSGSDLSISQNGTVLAIAGTLVQDDLEIAVVRVLTKNMTSGNYSLSRDPMDFTDDYVPSAVGISANGEKLAVGINMHSSDTNTEEEDQGALFVAALVNSTDYERVGQVDGRSKDDLLGSRVCISRDGTLAAASSRKGYVSFFKLG